MSSDSAPDDSAGRSRVPWTLVWAVLLAAGLAAWVASAALGDADRAWRAMLINFIYFTPLAGGMVVWPAAVMVARGQWMGPARRAALAALAFAPVSMVALVALWLGKDHWAPWLHGGKEATAAWLNAPLLFTRDVAALAGFWVLAGVFAVRAGRGRQPKRLAACLVLTYAIVFSLLGMDLVMALDAHWFSTLFGGYFFVSGMYIAVAAWTFILLVGGPQPDVRVRHDLGKLIVAFSLLTTYMMYSQLVVIWYENLPDEVRFVIPRLKDTQWPVVSAALLGTVYLGPLVLLLTRRAKKSPVFLGAVALLVLAAMWIERWWLVTPTLGGPPALGWQEACITAAFAAALALAVRSRAVAATPQALEAPPA